MIMIENVLLKTAPMDAAMMMKAQIHLDNLTKPAQSLGKLENFAKRVVGITRNPRPIFKNKIIFTLAADHGVAREGVSSFPQKVTEQMIYNFLNGGAGVNVLARHIKARVIVGDMGTIGVIKTDHPDFFSKKIAGGTKNIINGPAMTQDEAIRSIEAGIELFLSEHRRCPIDIVGLGEMGIANTTAASAITSCVTRSAVRDVTGRGTGITEDQLKNKIFTIQEALKTNTPNINDPVDILEKVGGFEIGGLVGIILAAAAERVPVVLDGFITASAALLATNLSPLSKEYLFASHNSVERGHRVALEAMGLEAMFDFNMRLGEGTGACLGISMIEAGVKILNEMATFESAGVART